MNPPSKRRSSWTGTAGTPSGQPSASSDPQPKRDSAIRRTSMQLIQMTGMVKRASIVSSKHPSSESEEASKPVVYHSTILGVVLAIASSAVLSLVNVIIKRLPTVSILEVLTFMAFGVFIGILPAATHEVDPFGSRQAQPLLFVRTVLSSVASLLRLSSLSYLSVADASIVASLTPLMVSLTALVFFSERFHWTQGVAVGTCVFGLALLTKPPITSPMDSFAKAQFIGIAYGLAHTALNGVTTVCIRAIKGVSRKVVVFHYGCLSMLLVSLVSVATSKMKIFYEGSQIGYLLLISHLTFATQMFLTKALQVESSSVVIVIKTVSDVIFGFLLQLAFLPDWPDPLSYIGGLLVTGSVVLIGFRKVVVNSAQESAVRKRFNFLI
ncbi:transmembrane protein, putative [Ixodes scapularis]|uniref:Transmembrane protein, putative n=1 Tax=Ixodes scapularis TaxID=6945 RepID=B7PPL6_IXOSC|nr:transmembrane protein, putative [Ixodes scapularis]|eukprot:XP_002435708.1 transmembrane protein, putative [Ixodes scapularis]